MSGDEPPTFKTCSEVNADCPVEATPYADYLSTPANVLFLIAFLLPFLINVINGLRGRMWSYTFWLGLAFVFEIIGYLGRILVSRRPWSMFGFAVGFLFLLLGPTLMAAAISVTFKHIVVWYGPKWSVIKPSLLPWIFVGTDFLSILIQLIGGAATTSANTGEEDNESLRKIGEAVTVGGVSFQIANMVICAGLMLFYAWRRKRDLAKERRSPKSDWNPGYPTGHAAAAGYNADEMQQIPIGGPDQRFNGYNQQWQNPGYPTPGYQQQQAPVSRPENSRNGASLKEAKRAKLFCYALGASYGLIIIRCIYRVFESLPGMARDVLQNEPLFYGLDSVPILLAVLILTVFHPFYFFPALKPSRKAKKAAKEAKKALKAQKKEQKEQYAQYA